MGYIQKKMSEKIENKFPLQDSRINILKGVKYEHETSNENWKEPVTKLKGLSDFYKDMEADNMLMTNFQQNIAKIFFQTNLHQINDAALFTKLVLTFIKEIKRNIEECLTFALMLTETDTYSTFDGTAQDIRNKINNIDE